MESDRTCKRCSVARVNTLCKSYQKAHSHQGATTLASIREIAQLAKSRGFDGATVLLTPGLTEKDLRAHCWNISSFLKDEEVERILGNA